MFRAKGLRSLPLLAAAAFAVLGGHARDAQAQGSPPCGANGSVQGLEIIGLTSDQRLFCFRDTEAANGRPIGTIRGLAPGERMISMDFRPSDGRLYGLSNAGNVYRINEQTADAQRVSTLREVNGGRQVQLSGPSFGIDFNPVTDQMRVVTETGDSMRVNPDSGNTTIDPRLNPGTGTGIAAIAYTNNDMDESSGTLLYAIDTRNDSIVIQVPENSGTVTTIRSIGTDVQTDSAFDIFSLIQEDTSVALVALAAVTTRNVSSLVEVDLATGLIGLIAEFSLDDRIIGIAIPPQQTGQPSPAAGDAADLAPDPGDDPDLDPGFDPGSEPPLTPDPPGFGDDFFIPGS